MSHPSVDRRTNRTHKSKSFEDSYTLSLSLFRGTLSLSQEVMEIFDLQWVNLLSEIFTIPRQGGGGAKSEREKKEEEYRKRKRNRAVNDDYDGTEDGEPLERQPRVTLKQFFFFFFFFFFSFEETEQPHFPFSLGATEKREENQSF